MGLIGLSTLLTSSSIVKKFSRKRETKMLLEQVGDRDDLANPLIEFDKRTLKCCTRARVNVNIFIGDYISRAYWAYHSAVTE